MVREIFDDIQRRLGFYLSWSLFLWALNYKKRDLIYILKYFCMIKKIIVLDI